MKELVVSRAGPPEVLELREARDPEVHPGQVRVRVEAAGVCFADLMARLGLYPDAPKFPFVPGYEVAGVIDRVGPDVDPARCGRPVVALTPFGGYSTHVVVPDSYAVPRPPDMTAQVAAALPVNGLTAWMLTQELFRVRQGDRVLIHSAGGGVGLAAFDLAKWKGATVVGVASSHKHPFLLGRGFDQVVDDHGEDPKGALGPDSRFDLVLDPIGGAHLEESFRRVAMGGCLACYGYQAAIPSQSRSLWAAIRTLLGVPWLTFNPAALAQANRAVAGVNMVKIASEPERARRWLVEILRLWTDGVLRPHVHAEIPFSRAPEAHRILHARENIGKVVLVPD